MIWPCQPAQGLILRAAPHRYIPERNQILVPIDNIIEAPFELYYGLLDDRTKSLLIHATLWQIRSDRRHVALEETMFVFAILKLAVSAPDKPQAVA
jgi:hypothetical protein